MTTCFKCGQDYRVVYRGGRFVNLNTSDDREHWRTCTGRGPNRQRARVMRQPKSSPSCRECGAGIKWGQSPKGRPMPLDVDGAPHWIACKQRAKKLRTPEVRKGARITGKDYVPSCGKCEVPAWESCACSALLPASGMVERLEAEADARLQHLLLDPA